MAFHEAFWITTAGVAPVIALAATVSASDVKRDAEHWLLFKRDIEKAQLSPEQAATLRDETWWSRQIGRRLFLAWLPQLNIGVQAALLAVSLLSVVYGTNVVSPLIGVAAAVLGVMVIAVVGQMASSRRVDSSTWRQYSLHEGILPVRRSASE